MLEYQVFLFNPENSFVPIRCQISLRGNKLYLINSYNYIFKQKFSYVWIPSEAGTSFYEYNF